MPLLPEFLSFAHALADAAGEVIRPLFGKDIAVDSKQDNSPVTVADREAERVMRERIMQRYPDHGIWGEEFGRHRPEARYCWVLDPVDGTRSFIKGLAVFGTLVSLVRLGVPVLGLIDQPIQKERWIGVSGASALNGENIAVRSCADLKSAALSTTSPDLFSAADKVKFERVREQARSVTYGYDCYAYAQLASGNLDLVIESGLKPHDFCALRPVIEGAGGIITDWQGAPLTLASGGHVIAAGDKRVHARALEMLR